MQRIWEVTITATSYQAAADVNFLASNGTPPNRLRIYNTGGFPVYASRDGTNNHDYIHSGLQPLTYDPMLVAVGSLWFKLETAGSTTLKIVEY